MKKTIFWSWQSDINPSLNRNFIRSAIIDSLRTLSKELNLEESDRLEIDHDTKDEKGMVSIESAIFDKIKTSTLLISDVTPIAKTDTGKLLQNPNVMIELGYGFHDLGHSRVISILNTSDGTKIEDLPFDIRHRRIMTYSLAATATLSEKNKILSKLSAYLADAIKNNISEILGEASPIEAINGVESDPEAPGLWRAQWPVEHSTFFGGRRLVSPAKNHRSWLRIIPADYSNNHPPMTSLENLPDGIRLHAPSAGERSGDSGACEFGYLAYWISSGPSDDNITACNLAAYLEESGEVWFSDGSAFRSMGDIIYINHNRILKNWMKAIRQGMALLDAIDAPKRRKVIIGIEGLSAAEWHIQTGFSPRRSRKNNFNKECEKSRWNEEDCKKLVFDSWNILRDIYNIVPDTFENFEKIAN